MFIEKYTSQLAETLSISSITIDRGVLSRSKCSKSIVSEYSEALQRGSQFPPITVFYDGCNYWLSDGLHRVLAMQEIGRMNIQATVLFGSRRDAILFATGTNSKHGFRDQPMFDQ